MLKFHIKQQRVSRNILKLHSQFQSSRNVTERCLPYNVRSQEVFESKAVHPMCRVYFLAQKSNLLQHPAHWEEPTSCSRTPMRGPGEHMWEVASLGAVTHSLHMLSETEVPSQPWLEAHKAPHCEVPAKAWGKERVIKNGLQPICSFHAFVGRGLSFIKNRKNYFSVSFPGNK